MPECQRYSKTWAKYRHPANNKIILPGWFPEFDRFLSVKYKHIWRITIFSLDEIEIKTSTWLILLRILKIIKWVCGFFFISFSFTNREMMEARVSFSSPIMCVRWILIYRNTCLKFFVGLLLQTQQPKIETGDRHLQSRVIQNREKPFCEYLTGLCQKILEDCTTIRFPSLVSSRLISLRGLMAY